LHEGLKGSVVTSPTVTNKILFIWRGVVVRLPMKPSRIAK
jgi:hypothetical protein